MRRTKYLTRIIYKLNQGGNFLAVNVGADEWVYQVKELAEAVAKIIPDVGVSINKDGQPDKRSYKVNFNRFKRIAPNHQPQVDLTSSIEHLKIGLETIGFDNGDFRNSTFMRLKVITHLIDRKLLNENLQWIKPAN